MKTEIRIEAEMTDEQLDCFISEIKNTAEVIGIKLEVESSKLIQHDARGLLDNSYAEQELHKYNKWLMEVWNPNQLNIPFAADAPRAYLDYRNNVKNQPSMTIVVKNDIKKSCQNCKFYTADKNRCNHNYWSWCVKRDDEGFVTSYSYHQFR